MDFASMAIIIMPTIVADAIAIVVPLLSAAPFQEKLKIPHRE